MKKLFAVIICFLFCNFHTPLKATLNNSILATVNDHNIFKSDIENRLNMLKLLDPNFKNNNTTFKKFLLTQIIEEVLLIEEAKKYNFTITKEDVVSQINYIESLNKWNKGYIYKKGKELNLTKENINNYFFNQVLAQKFIQSIGFSKASVNNDEVDKEFYNLLNLNGKTQYLLSEIFISTTDKPYEVAQNQINSIYKNLKKGGNFNVLVSSYSENIYSKNNKGIIGWIYETQLTNNENELLSALKINQYSPPICLEAGFYIYKLLDKKPIIYLDSQNSETTSKVKEMLKEKLLTEKAQEVIKSYITKLKDSAIITYY